MCLGCLSHAGLGPRFINGWSNLTRGRGLVRVDLLAGASGGTASSTFATKIPPPVDFLFLPPSTAFKGGKATLRVVGLGICQVLAEFWLTAFDVGALPHYLPDPLCE